MAYPDGDIQAYQSLFQARRRLQILGLVIVVVVALLAVIARLSDSALPGLPLSFWGPVAAIVLVAKIIFLLVNWRCPRCNAVLGPNYSPRFCSKCGLEFGAKD
jgi:hypothetical protein